MGEILYCNDLTTLDDLDGWVAEGPHHAEAADDGLLFSSSGGWDDHWVLWCPEKFPDAVSIEWDFSPREEPGLAMLFFGAMGVGGRDLFDPSLAVRTGKYPQYHSSDVHTLHASYFRRRWEDERAFHTANLRKSPGFHLVTQGADPIPPVVDAKGAFYRIRVTKDGAAVSMAVDDLDLWRWTDDESTGPRVRDGYIGFRQMAPLVGCYRNLEVRAL